MFGRQRGEDGVEKAAAATRAVMQYALELRDTRWNPGDATMLGELATFEREGVKITESEFVNMFMSLLIAGFETTHTLIGQSFRLMLEDPEIAAQGREAMAAEHGRELVDEFLRYVTPAMHMARHATRDVELHGKTIQ